MQSGKGQGICKKNRIFFGCFLQCFEQIDGTLKISMQGSTSQDFDIWQAREGVRVEKRQRDAGGREKERWMSYLPAILLYGRKRLDLKEDWNFQQLQEQRKTQPGDKARKM
ncbi:hypothetical protein FGO68_gene9559 [Halteria grandinella]|uniref:Uncharacterized protein n=1 Tax=Halteria grandinella TaxID=5974 RepID=A0A8J8SV35_HALGN|nr:hypothetical protein FGO68_gene9559 [Halteria grandinella]